MNFLPVLQTVLGIGFLIFIHELGHFLAARLAGVRVETFSLGFGPRLFGFVRRGTDYRLSLVPLGGYVKVAGEDPLERRYLAPDDLHSKGFLARGLFFSGGVLMNLLFAFIAFPLVFHSGVEFTAPVLGQVVPGGAAWEAGLQRGDRIRRVGNKEMYSFENLSVEVALTAGDQVELEVERDGTTFTVPVRPRYLPEQGIRMIEVSPAPAPEPPVLEVEPGSPAAAAGLRDGDRLLRVNGERADPASSDELLAKLDTPGRELELVVERAGQTQPPIRFVIGTRQGSPVIGVMRARRRVHGLRPHPAIERLGLLRGDHIVAVDGQPFTGGKRLTLPGNGTELELVVERGPTRQTVRLATTLEPGERAALEERIALGTDRTALVVEPRPDSAAAKAGLQPGDELLRVDGKTLTTWDDLTAAVRAAADRTMRVELRRGQQQLSLELRAQPMAQPHPGFDARVALARELHQVQGFGPSLRAGMVCSIDLIKQLYVTLKKLFTGEVAASNLGGIITISRVSYDQAQSGWARFIYFLALLSINLAFINVLPIPVLDGGHLLFLLIERVKGSPVSARVLNYSQILGLVFVLALMVFVTFNDIRRLL